MTDRISKDGKIKMSDMVKHCDEKHCVIDFKNRNV